jgi:hypothetical protein
MSPTRPTADANLFPSERPGAQDGAYAVSFGGAFSVDQFGFVRRGMLVIQPDAIRYEGRSKRSLAARWGMFLLITFVPLLLLGVGVGLVLAYAIVNYVWVVDATLRIPARAIASVTRDGCRIRFTAAHPETGKTCRSDIRFALESEAIAAERAISGMIARSHADRTLQSARRAA